MNELLILIASCFGVSINNTVIPEQIPWSYGCITNEQRANPKERERLRQSYYKRYQREEIEAWCHFKDLTKELYEGD